MSSSSFSRYSFVFKSNFLVSNVSCVFEGDIVLVGIAHVPFRIPASRLFPAGQLTHRIIYPFWRARGQQ